MVEIELEERDKDSDVVIVSFSMDLNGIMEFVNCKSFSLDDFNEVLNGMESTFVAVERREEED